MKIGEVVETLIWLRNRHDLTRTEDDAVCSACNILDRLPSMMDEDTAKETLRQFSADYEKLKAALLDAELTLEKMQGAGGQFCDDAIAGYHERKKEREAGRKTA